MRRPRSVRAAGALVALALAVAAPGGCTGRSGPESSDLQAAFTRDMERLGVEAEACARILAGLRDGPASPEAFWALAARLPGVARPGDGAIAALSAWDAAGLPAAWAGPVGLVPPVDTTPGRRYQVLNRGGAVHLLARAGGPGQGLTVAEAIFPPGTRWNPASLRGNEPAILFEVGHPPPEGAVPLQAPDGLTLGYLKPVASASVVPVEPGILARAGALAAVLLVLSSWALARRWRSSDAILAAPLLLSTGIWATRAALHAVLRDPALQGPLTDASLFATPAPFGLLRSPADTLATGLALAIQAAVVGRFLRTRAGWLPPALVRTLAVAGLAGALLLALRAGPDSPLNLLSLATPPHPGVRMVVLCGLFLIAWAPCLLAAWGGFPRTALHPAWTGLLLAPLAAGLLFVALASGFKEARHHLVESNLRPLVLAQEEERIRSLDLSRRRLQADPSVGDEVERALAEQRAHDLAYRLWRQTDLAARGYHSSLELYDAAGQLRGAFGVEMPPPVPAGGEPSDNLTPVDRQTVVFATLSQEKETLFARWPLAGPGGPVGAIALYVSNELDNVPFLRMEPTVWTREPGGDSILSAADLLNSDIIAVAYGSGNRLLWSAHPDPPPLPVGLRVADMEGGMEWSESESAGHQVRLLYFGDGTRLYGVGFHLDRLTDQLARLLRLSLFLTAVAGALTAVAWFLLFKPGRGQGAPGSLLGALGRSYSRKLAGAVLIASLVPLLALSLVLRGSLDRQRREILLALGLSSVGVAERVVRDAAATMEPSAGTPLPDDDTLFWLSRVIGQEIDLFADGVLVASSRRGLFDAGLLSSLPPAGMFRRLVLGGEHTLLTGEEAGDPTVSSISVPLPLAGGRPAILSLPLHAQEAEVERRIREVQELTDLATAAVALLLLGASIALGRGMSARLTRLSAATERMARGEPAVHVATSSRDEVGRLTESFNIMARVLGEQRAALERRTEMLEKILLHAPTGIVSLDRADAVVMANPAAGRVLQAAVLPTPGTPLRSVLDSSPYRGGLTRLLQPPAEAPTLREAELSPDGGGEGRLRAVAVHLPGSGRLILLEDVTEAVRSNRLAAWAEMARRIAHEIKNPLTPIRLSAEHLRRVHDEGDPRLAATLSRTVETILEQVEALREIASDFSLYARIPVITRRPVSPGRLLAEAVGPYAAAPPDGVVVVQEIPDGLPGISVDGGLIRRALVNLLENALHAMPDGGTLRASAHLASGGREVVLAIADTGEGMDADTRARLFEPYFSTRDAGTGLGLAIARRAVEEHGGRIEVDSEPGRGATFSVVLPVAAGADAAAQT